MRSFKTFLTEERMRPKEVHNLKELEDAELEIGIEVEMEHTDDRKEAEKIAKDHLKEKPDYYSRLVQAGLVDEEKAMELYDKYFGSVLVIAIETIDRKAAYDAAQTQRGIPENTMVNAQIKLGELGIPQIIINRIEHYGDLSHRAQEGYGPGYVKEKIYGGFNAAIMEEPGAWNSDKEIVTNLFENIMFRFSQERNEPFNYETIQQYSTQHRKEIQNRVRDAIIKAIPILNDYIEAHEDHNDAITYAGKLGKNIAIQFAKYAKEVFGKIQGSLPNMNLGQSEYDFKLSSLSTLQSQIDDLRKWVKEVEASDGADEVLFKE